MASIANVATPVYRLCTQRHFRKVSLTPSFTNREIKNREWTERELSSLGFTYLDSKANFIFAKSDKIDGKALYLALKEKGVLVRHFDAPRISDYNRITIGNAEEMQILVDKIKEILNK